MRIAFLIYDGMTALDFLGVYDPLTRLKTMNLLAEVGWEICATSAEVRDSTGLWFRATRVGESLEGYAMVVVPGGFGSRKLVRDSGFLEWLRTARSCRWKVSVCTGALLLGAAGFLDGKTATTHPTAFDDLRPYCKFVSDQRIVDEGDVITAGGVTAGIDLGLYLCGKLAGSEARERIRRQMDYRRE